MKIITEIESVVEFQVDINDEASIEAAEDLKATLEEDGFTLVKETATPLTATFKYVNGRWLNYWTGQIQQWQYGGNHFTAEMLRLTDKADLGNRECIRKGFPDLVRAYEMWYVGEIKVDG